MSGQDTVRSLEEAQEKIAYYKAWVAKLWNVVEQQMYDERFGAGAYFRDLARTRAADRGRAA